MHYIDVGLMNFINLQVLTVIVDCCAREMGEKVLCDSPAEQQPFLSIAKVRIMKVLP